MVRFHAQCEEPIAIRILRRGERGKRPGYPYFIGCRSAYFHSILIRDGSNFPRFAGRIVTVINSSMT